MRRVWLWLTTIVVLTLLVGVGIYGFQPETRLWAFQASDRQLLWSSPLADNETGLYSRYGPLTSNGRIFTWVRQADRTNEQLSFAAWDAASGQRQWTYDLPADLFPDDFTMSQITATRVYLVGEDTDESRRLIALDQADGRELWMLPQVVAIATDDEDVLVLAGRDGNFTLSRHSADGQEIWSQPTPLAEDEVWQTQRLTIDAQNTYVLRQSYRALSEASPENPQDYLLQPFELQTGVEQPSITYQGNTPIFITGVANNDSEGYEAVALSDGQAEQLWSFQEPSNRADGEPRYLRNMSSNDTTVYLTYREYDAGMERSYWILALDRSDGSVRWRSDLRETSTITANPLKLGGEVLVYHNRDSVIVFSQESGAELWRFTPFEQTILKYAADESRVFVMDEAPRWRNWLTQLQIAG